MDGSNTRANDSSRPGRSPFFQAMLSNPAVHLLFIMLIGIASYSNTLNAPFQFDDWIFIKDNPVIQSLDNFLLSSKGYEYQSRRFIAFLTFALNYRFGAYDVTGYHLFNLAIHLINALLVYALVLLTFRTTSPLHPSPFTIHDSRLTRSIAFFSALLFVTHPVQTQAVTYIYQRLTSLATMFYLCSVAAYVLARTSASISGPGSPATRRMKTVGLYFLSLVSAVLAMKTKEIAFTLPIVIVVYEFIFFKTTIKKKLLVVLPVLVMLVIIPISIIGTDKPLGVVLSDISEKSRLQTDMPRWDYLMTQMRVIMTYLRLIFLPIDQNLDYDYPLSHSFFEPAVMFSFFFLCALAGLGIYFLRKARQEPPAVDRPGNTDPFRAFLYRVAAFGIFWFFITLSVESSVIPIVDVIFEHRIYLPSVGAFLAITASAYIIAGKLRASWHTIDNAVALAFILAVLALAAASFSRNAVWGNETALWEDVQKKSPNNPRAYNSLGTFQLEKDRYGQAIELFGKAISLKPSYAEAYINRGFAYGEAGQTENAIKDYDAAIALNPLKYEAYNNKGMVYGKAGLFNKAIEQFTKAIEINGSIALAFGNRGLAYSFMGKYDLALQDVDKAIELDSTYAEAYGTRGSVYLKAGKKELADADFRRACELGDQEACKTLGSR